MIIECELMLGPSVNQIWQSWINSSYLTHTTHLGGNFLCFIIKIETGSKWMPECEQFYAKMESRCLAFYQEGYSPLSGCLGPSPPLTHHGLPTPQQLKPVTCPKSPLWQHPAPNLTYSLPSQFQIFLQTLHSLGVLSTLENKNIDLCLGVNSWQQLLM